MFPFHSKLDIIGAKIARSVWFLSPDTLIKMFLFILKNKNKNQNQKNTG